jgi:hypothetical protein
MKNFLIAFAVFLVWSFFGLWLYSWLQPINSSVQNKDNIANNENAEVRLDIDDPLQLDEPIITIDKTKDTLGLIENVEDLSVDVEIPSGLKAIKKFFIKVSGYIKRNSEFCLVLEQT